MSQSGVLPSANQIESMSKYPNPRNLRYMRGFMELINQSIFCLSPQTRKLMEDLKNTLKYTKQWEWSKTNQITFESLKENLVNDCETGIKWLTSHGDTPLVIISDWSKAGCGFTLYEVTCDYPKSCDVVTIITDHKPILNLLQDRTRTINNKRLTNLRRKCDGFIFKTGYHSSQIASKKIKNKINF